MPPSVDANKRVLLYRVPRGVVSIISPWNWPYTMPAEILAPAIAYGNTVVWAPAPTHVALRGEARRVHGGGRHPAGRREHGHRTGPRRRRRDRRRTRGPRPSGSSARSPPGSRVAGRAARQGAPARDGRQRAARGDGRRRPRCGRRGHADGLLPERRARAARPASGSWCTRTCATSTSRCWPPRSTKQIRLGDPFDDATTLGPSTTSRPPQDGAPRARRRRSRRGGAGRRRAARRATAATCSSRRPCWTASRPTWRSPARRRSAPWRRSSTIRSVDEAIDAVNGSPYGLLSAVFTARPGPRAALRRGRARRMGERQRGHELLGVAPAVRRPGGLAERRRAGGRPVLDGSPDRAEDRRANLGSSRASLLRTQPQLVTATPRVHHREQSSGRHGRAKEATGCATGRRR